MEDASRTAVLHACAVASFHRFVEIVGVALVGGVHLDSSVNISISGNRTQA